MVNSLKPRWSVMLPKTLDEMQREVDHLFDRVVGDSTAKDWRAPLSLWEEEGRWCVEMDLPGVPRESLDVTLDKNVLSIAAERNSMEDRKYWHAERGFGRIERQVKLPETVDPEGIEAELKDGVLFVSIRKKPEAQPKKIEIKTA